MKYKIGDKVRIRKDLVVGKTYGDNSYVERMDEVVRKHDYVLTIKDYSCDNTQYRVEEDAYNWTDEMIEKLYVVDTDTKFEAFLKEVVDVDCDGDLDAWNKIRNLVQGRCGDSKEETIQWLTDFYSKFVPKDEVVKKMTKAEIEKELGYEIEIVEE